MWDLWAEGEAISPYAELMTYQGEINNGGHDQYFTNVENTGDLQKEMSALEKILPPKLKNNLQMAYEAYLVLEEKEEEQLYCEHCKLFLADRYIIGICPKCGSEIKGDECEKCGSLLTIDEVKETRCSICGNKTSYKTNKNLYFKLSNFQDDIKGLLESKRNLWRENAVNFTERYLKGIPEDSRVKTDGRFLNEKSISKEKLEKIFLFKYSKGVCYEKTYAFNYGGRHG